MNTNLFPQLCLDLQIPDEATFDNFHTSESNKALLHHLKTFFDHQDNLYIWSASQQGRTHLLHALCRLADEKKYNPMYLSLKQNSEFEVGVLQNLEIYDLLCLDDLNDIAGNAVWEEALFHLYNRMHAQKKKLVFAANIPPAQLNLDLADLKSRLSACTVFNIQPLNDLEKLTLLQRRAQNRGLALSTKVGKFLLDHASRDMPSLFQMLDLLDKASLSAKQALTIPFIKRVLEI
jgi:DnaA family protein